MDKAVSLPFSIPLFSCYHNMAAVGLAFMGHPGAEIQWYNQCTDLTCEPKFLQGYTGASVSVIDASVNRFSNLERYVMMLRYAQDFYDEIIHTMIDNGVYVYFQEFDDYYIPEKSFYQIKHRKHDGILFGYDDFEKTYDIAAYDINWQFRRIRVSKKAFEESMKGAFVQGYNPKFMGITPKTDPVTLDIRGICEKLHKYLNPPVGVSTSPEADKVTGIVVYDYFAMYMDKLLDGSIPHESMDWRPMRIIWEFRKCMLARIVAIEDALGLSSGFSRQYETLVEQTDRLRMLYAVYVQKRRDSLLKSVRDGLLDLKKQEQVLLEKFVTKTEEALSIYETLENHSQELAQNPSTEDL